MFSFLSESDVHEYTFSSPEEIKGLSEEFSMGWKFGVEKPSGVKWDSCKKCYEKVVVAA